MPRAPTASSSLSRPGEQAEHAHAVDELDERALPVIEIFGPTLQGEGPDAGKPAYFVRFGGCDYRCHWCDSLFAVEPDQVRAAPRMSVAGIHAALAKLPVGPELVILSGGNPALFELAGLVARLHDDGFRVAVETQGSVWRDWLRKADHLVLSPKPPSSGMCSTDHAGQWERFLAALHRHPGPAVALKLVVFDERDLEWAQAVHVETPELELFLSVGTDPPSGDPVLDRARLERRYRWAWQAVAGRPALAGARLLPQLHVLAFGDRRAV